MNKRVTDKLNQNVRKALYLAHNQALTIEGFCKFTYTLEWHDFPSSLRVTCHLNSKEQLQNFTNKHLEASVIKILQHDFLKVGIKFRDVNRSILFTS